MMVQKLLICRGGIVNFAYFENVFSPMVTAQALIVNTGNVVPDDDGDVSLFIMVYH